MHGGQDEAIVARKWYVVFIGRRPGVYKTWPDCSLQVTGYSGALFKSYSFREEVETAYGRWLGHTRYFPMRGCAQSSSRHYVVFIGRVLGVYESWPECYVQVNRYRGALHKSYPNKEQAEDAYRRWQEGEVSSQNSTNAGSCHQSSFLQQRSSGHTLWGNGSRTRLSYETSIGGDVQTLRTNNIIHHNGGASASDEWLHGFVAGLGAALLSAAAESHHPSGDE